MLQAPITPTSTAAEPATHARLDTRISLKHERGAARTRAHITDCRGEAAGEKAQREQIAVENTPSRVAYTLDFDAEPGGSDLCDETTHER